jgi:large subunit ribosomal protein L5
MGEMRGLRIEKTVVNIGVGEAGERLLKAQKVLEMLTTQKPVETISKTTNKDLGIRKGMPIGCRVTLRGERAEEFLKRALWVKNNKLADYNFDPEGNFSFGVPDYTEFEGMKYDPEIGIFGMDVSVTLKRPGYRVVMRRRVTSKIPRRHRVTREEGIHFMQDKFGVEVIG